MNTIKQRYKIWANFGRTLKKFEEKTKNLKQIWKNVSDRNFE